MTTLTTEDDGGVSLPVIDEPKETEAGNYFVSNYPPFSFWSPDRVHEAMAAVEQPAPADRPLGVYMHIPFCRKRCHFCYFKVYTDKNADAIKRYMDAALAELATFADAAFVNGRKPKFVYFGGGTPSYLSVKQLTYLFDGMKSLLPWDAAEEVTFECEPGTLQESKVHALQEMGVTRLSLGVENFEDHVLETNGRAHLSKQVYRAYDWAQDAGFPQVNIDLIAGMLEETDENWQRNIAETRRLSPDSVTIYQMEIPFNTTIYQRMKSEGKLTAPVADWATKRRWVSEAFDALEEDGYHVGSAYTAVKGDDQRFLYRDLLWQGADLIGAGVASFGLINGVHMQNQHKFEPYVDAVEAGRTPIYRALRMTDEERLVREFILQMKLGRVPRDYFVDKFGVDPTRRWAEELAALDEVGVSVTDFGVEMTREALLKVDTLLHAFFLPEHRGARYT